MKRSPSLEDALEGAVSAGLQSQLGDAAGVVSVFLDPGIAVSKPDSYVKSLSKMLPAGAKVETVVTAICQRLYEDLGLQFQQREGWKLSDYVNDATGKVESAGDYKEASKAFKRVAEDYRLTAQKIPGLSLVLTELASYMDAWSSIGEARSQHQEEHYSTASENYAKAADILKATKARSHLSKHYEACTLLEKGEAYSSEENPEASIESFKTAVDAFRKAKTGLENMLAQDPAPQEKQDQQKWVEITRSRERYCLGRAELEEARILDKKGDEEGSSARYRSASQRFEELAAEAQTDQARWELETLALSCHAWAEMKEAESGASPELYAEAADLFSKVEKITPRKRFRLLALASSSMCKALEAGTRFRRTRNTQLYSEIKKALETATDYYQAAGLQNAADWTRATGKLFDALVYLTDAAVERESRRKAELFQLAEKHLELAARLYGHAGFTIKTDQADQPLKRARQDMQLLMSPIEALAQTPALTGVAVAPVSLVREKTFGLERVDAANIVGNPNLSQRNVSVGSELTLELEIANVGKTPATLTRLENIVEDGLELIRQKTVYPVENNAFDMKGKRLDYLKTLTVKVPLKATRKGTLELRPRIFFHDQKGFHGSYDFDATSLTIRDLGISGWLKGPKQ